MNKTTFGMAVSAFLLAGAFGFAGTGAASAQSASKVCADQWKAAKAAGTTEGKTRKDFVAGCMETQKGAAAPAAAAPAAAPAATPAAAPAAAPAAPAATTPAATAAAPMKKPKPVAMAAGPGQFAAEAEAKAKCPTDAVVWVNTKTKKYHYANAAKYGKTKQGAYMCEADASAAGAVAAKNEKKP